MMDTAKLLELARTAAAAAKGAGASDARINVARSRSVEVEWRDGKIDRLKESTTQGLAFSLYVDGRYSSSSTSDLRPSSIDAFIRESVAMTRYLAPDPHRKLPEPSRYEGLFQGDLGIDDPSVFSVEANSRPRMAKELEDAVRAHDSKGIVESVTSSVSDNEWISVLVNTNGFDGQESGTSTFHSVEAAVRGENQRRPIGDSYAGGPSRRDLRPASELGKDAFQRACAQIGSKQIPTGKYDVVIENRVAGSLSRHLLGALGGGALQQRRSFLEGKLGLPIGSKHLHITSDPHLRGGLSTHVFDGEGMATRVMPVFEDGVLRTYLLDTYYASKLGMKPTSGSFGNLLWRTGKKDRTTLVSGLKNGLYITSFVGGNSNSTTGDFSLGFKGFHVKDGKLGQPVSEMNLAGNHLELWKSLAEIGSDPWPYAGNRSPSLLLRQVTCSGGGA
ncbi:MAG: TldD/PmbA family protein [Myxococcota bacterium]|jgi:PmbA protein|nr:TldD/PmbA family protein [Myxococcota bacterium]